VAAKSNKARQVRKFETTAHASHSDWARAFCAEGASRWEQGAYNHRAPVVGGKRTYQALSTLICPHGLSEELLAERKHRAACSSTFGSAGLPLPQLTSRTLHCSIVQNCMPTKEVLSRCCWSLLPLQLMSLLLFLLLACSLLVSQGPNRARRIPGANACRQKYDLSAGRGKYLQGLAFLVCQLLVCMAGLEVRLAALICWPRNKIVLHGWFNGLLEGAGLRR